jgi:CheY-like chemotaxis protein
MTVLIIDDEPVALRLMTLMLTRQRYFVHAVSSAESALEWLAERHPVELVITDNFLGGMSGLELFSRMQEDMRLCEIPVVLCTSAADIETVTEAIQRGLRHYLVKPISADALHEKVVLALASRVRVLEPRYECMGRLAINEAQYLMMAAQIRERVAALSVSLAAAELAYDDKALTWVAEQLREPSRLIGAGRCSAAAEKLATCAVPERPAAAERLAREIGLLSEALVSASRPLPMAPRGNVIGMGGYR